MFHDGSNQLAHISLEIVETNRMTNAMIHTEKKQWTGKARWDKQYSAAPTHLTGSC